MSVTTTGIPALAAQAVQIQAEKANAEVNIKLLKKSLDFEKQITQELLKSLGIGQLIDIAV